jgi:hypothetical protein
MNEHTELRRRQTDGSKRGAEVSLPQARCPIKEEGGDVSQFTARGVLVCR